MSERVRPANELPVLHSPVLVASPPGGIPDRRQFLELMAASLALSGAAGCSVRQPREEIVPQVRSPEYTIPGVPRFYATAVTLGGYATRVLVESHEGRPTRIDGNADPDRPEQPVGIDAISQAAILSLYDPDRSQAITAGREIRTWDSLVAAMGPVLKAQADKEGAGVRILTETVTSPTLAAQLTKLLERFPRAKWHQYESVNSDNVLAGAQLAFGRPVETRYDFTLADVVVSLDADFLTRGPGHTRYTNDFISRRRLPSAKAQNGEPPMNRLYIVETEVTNTGAVADHRLPMSPQQIVSAARYLAAKLGVLADADSNTDLPQAARRWFDAVVADLRDKPSIVLAGPRQPPAVHAVVHAINARLGNAGRTVEYTQPVAVRPVIQIDSLRELVVDAQSGEVDLLLIAGGNPVYDAPADVPLREALARVGLSVRLGLYEDETSRHCHWHVPAAHELESWSDARAFDGAATILQPMIRPLYNGKTIHELLATLLGDAQATSHDIVRDYWKSEHGDDGFWQFWRKSLHDGIVPDTRFKAIEIADANVDDLEFDAPARSESSQIAVAFRPDPSIYDGRFANNSWLQELPKPITKLTWDNAALLSPRTAEQWGVQTEQFVELVCGGRTLRLPALIMPGHADNAITVYLGHGRTDAGNVGNGKGFDVSPLRTSTAFWTARDVSARAIDERYLLACTQQHHRMEGRSLVRSADWQDFREHPDFAKQAEHAPDVTLYGSSPSQPLDEQDDRTSDTDYAWGMSINLNACTGCNACVIACQAENNIPNVGKTEVHRAREMHWIRIDHYLVGDEDDPRSVHQPVTCMHCENAPCELVCPVAATVHSSEGLNEMVYNRCVGTRYCSNNCPYKVRRFNFLKFTDDETPVLKLLRNPNVTIRARGVMEKCTYCVQRISAARIAAKKEGRAIRDGEIATACQAACPTRAIVFGDTADPQSRVSELKSHPLDYGLLTELNTRPRTTYLARVTNPNPKLT